MDTGISIQGSSEKDVAENVTAAITAIFQAGHEFHMDQDTIRMGLDVFRSSVKVENISINGCSIDGGKTVNVT